MFKSQNYHN